MRGLSSVLLLVGFTSAMIAACGGDSAKKSRPSGEGGEGDAPSEDAGSAGEDASGGSNATGGSNAAGARGGTNGMPVGGSPGRMGIGGSLSTAGAGVGGMRPAGGVGGLSAAGAPAAGKPNMPMGGTSNVPQEEPEPPKDCSTGSHYSTETVCDFRFWCNEGERNYGVHCQRQTEDVWSCDCSGPSASPTMEIEGAERSAACSAAARACVSDHPAEEPSCELTTKSVTSGYCETGESCTLEVEIEPGVTATVTHKPGAWCTLSDGDTFSCQCSGTTDFVEYAATAPSTSVLCDSMVDFCKSGAEPEFTGPEVCTEQTASAFDGACEASAICSQSADIGGGVALLTPGGRYATCDPPKNGVARCTCSMGGETFAYDAALTSVDRDTCLTAVSSCSPATTIEPNGAIACKVIAQSAQVAYCSAELDCTQPIKIAGGEYTGHGRLLTACRRTAAGKPWFCGCATSKSSETFELGEVDAGWEACSQAGVRCQEEIDVYIGPSGDITVPEPEQSSD